jgi:hypothetical protein
MLNEHIYNIFINKVKVSFITKHRPGEYIRDIEAKIHEV